VTSDPRGRLFAWLHRHPSEADALRDVPPEVLGQLWADAWREGGWQAIHDSTEVGGLLERASQRMEWLIDLYRAAEVEREVEDGSAYYASDDAEELESLAF
jgi:hypothetical protein